MEFDIHTMLIPLTNLSVESFVEQYGNLAVFLGAVLLGEIAVLAAVIFSTQGFLSPLVVFVLSISGIIVADLLWYGVGAYSASPKNSLHLHDKSIIAQVSDFWGRTVGEHLYVSLLVVKFLYGFRIATIIFLGLRRLSLALFLPFELLGVTIFVSILFGVGWVTGKGVYDLIPYYRGAVVLLLSILLFFVVMQTLRFVFAKKLKYKKSDNLL